MAGRGYNAGIRSVGHSFMRPYRSNSEHNVRGDLKTIRTLLPYLWEFKGRVALALTMLILAKLANVAVPLVFKHIVDALGQQHALLAVPVMLVVGYGVLRRRAW